VTTREAELESALKHLALRFMAVLAGRSVRDADEVLVRAGVLLGGLPALGPCGRCGGTRLVGIGVEPEPCPDCCDGGTLQVEERTPREEELLRKLAVMVEGSACALLANYTTAVSEERGETRMDEVYARLVLMIRGELETVLDPAALRRHEVHVQRIRTMMREAAELATPGGHGA
jgi:hypothetical protein